MKEPIAEPAETLNQKCLAMVYILLKFRFVFNCDIFAEQTAERADHAFDQEWPAVVYALLLSLRFIL